MNRASLVKYVENVTGMHPNQIRLIINVALDGIYEGLKDDELVTLNKFGRFKLFTHPGKYPKENQQYIGITFKASRKKRYETILGKPLKNPPSWQKRIDERARRKAERKKSKKRSSTFIDEA